MSKCLKVLDCEMLNIFVFGMAAPLLLMLFKESVHAASNNDNECVLEIYYLDWKLLGRHESIAGLSFICMLPEYARAVNHMCTVLKTRTRILTEILKQQ